jgi:hypothetical protein
MTTSHDAPGTDDEDVYAALSLLVRPATFIAAIPTGGIGQQAMLMRHRELDCEVIGSIGCATATALRDYGWIAREADGSWQITRAGIQALRRRRSALGASSAASAPSAAIAASQLPKGPRLNEAESPLVWLRQRRGRDGEPLISEAQFLAGEKLRCDFTKAQMTPRVTATWSDTTPSRRQKRVTPGTGVDLADSVIVAKDRVRKALVAAGPELAGILLDVCCHLMGLEEAERLARLPQRSGKVLLLAGLSALARHYGFLNAAVAEHQIARRIRTWSDGDAGTNLEIWRDR